MGNLNGSKDENCNLWSEKERSLSDADSRKPRIFGYAGSGFGNKSQRMRRETNPRPKEFRGNATFGGMIRHLIHNYREQVARKDIEIKNAIEEKKNLELKILELETLTFEIKQETC